MWEFSSADSADRNVREIGHCAQMKLKPTNGEPERIYSASKHGTCRTGMREPQEPYRPRNASEHVVCVFREGEAPAEPGIAMTH